MNSYSILFGLILYIFYGTSLTADLRHLKFENIPSSVGNCTYVFITGILYPFSRCSL